MRKWFKPLPPPQPNKHQEDIIMLYGYMINFKNFSRKTIFNKFPMTRNQAVEALERAILYYKTEYPQAQIDSTLVIKRKY